MKNTFTIYLNTFLLFFLYSCGNAGRNSKQLEEKNEAQNELTVSTRYTLSWDQVNEYFDSVYKTTLNYRDIKAVLRVMQENKMTDTSIFIDNDQYPPISYISPSFMLDRIVSGSKSGYPDSIKLLTTDDKKFMLDQVRLFPACFSWQLVSNRIQWCRKYPYYALSVPVFSLDKNKFVVCIEKHLSMYKVQATSYYCIRLDGKTTFYVFDSRGGEGC